MTIRAIIFDLGGVLLRTTDFSRREQLAARLSITRSKLEEFIFGGESGNLAQSGGITVQQHWDHLRHQLNYSPEEFKALLDEFFSCDELDISMLDYVRKLHRTYKTALLSNAWDDMRQVITERLHIEDAFDRMIISAEVGLVKPDARIFQLAVERLGVDARQVIFVDDMQRNIDGAEAVGLHGIHFVNPQQMRRDLEQLLDRHRN